MNFKGKVVLVTGASRGIGREVCRQFAVAGATVVVHYNQNLSDAVLTQEAIGGDPHLLHQADITSPDEVRGMIDRVVSEMGRLDILVNNSAIFEPHEIAPASYEANPDANYEEWQQAWTRTIQTNLIGAANVTFCAAQPMIRQGGGKIVNVSSRGAFRGEPGAPAYGASKAGLNAMSQSLAQALAPHNIFVYVVAPGFVDTERVAPKVHGPLGEGIRAQSPLNRVARVDEVARTVLFLASEGTDFLTGTIVDVNGASYLRS